jgi:hypothetical protein
VRIGPYIAESAALRLIERLFPASHLVRPPQPPARPSFTFRQEQRPGAFQSADEVRAIFGTLLDDMMEDSELGTRFTDAGQS